MFSKSYDWSLCVIKNMYKMFGYCVSECGCSCFSKYFLLGNALK